MVPDTFVAPLPLLQVPLNTILTSCRPPPIAGPAEYPRESENSIKPYIKKKNVLVIIRQNNNCPEYKDSSDLQLTSELLI